jgi:hypothetical protein
MRFLAELDMAFLLALTACGGGTDRAPFQDRLFRFANAGIELASLEEPVRVHSPTFCQGLVTPASFAGPFRSVGDHARLRDLCIRQ